MVYILHAISYTVEQLKKLFRKASDIGVTEDMSFSQKLRVSLCNQCTVIGILLSVSHIVTIFIIGATPYEFSITIYWIFLFSISLAFNYARKYTFANNLLIFGTTLMIGTIQYYFGPTTRLEPIYLTTIIIAFFIIKPSYRLYVIATITLIYFGIVIYRAYNPGAPLENIINELAAYQYFIFGIILSSSLISKVVLENANYNKILAINNKKMAEQNEELKRFNYIISHDLKEPIRSIVALTGLLKKKINSEKETDIPDEIISLGRRLSNMINDIVKFQKLDTMTIDTEIFSLSQMIENIKANLPIELKQKNFTTSFSGIDEVYTSKTCTYIILKNLIENGIKYNDKTPEIAISCEYSSNNYKIIVTDNGIGIPDKYQNEIFVMFKRLNQNKSEKGTGLGLSISKKLAQKFGAELEIVTSSKDNGSTFKLTIPSSKASL